MSSLLRCLMLLLCVLIYVSHQHYHHAVSSLYFVIYFVLVQSAFLFNVHVFVFFFVFFFQAEDGIRDTSVTGVQTCALPISRGARAKAGGRPWECPFRAIRRGRAPPDRPRRRCRPGAPARAPRARAPRAQARSEERRVGKECRSRWPPSDENRKKRVKEENAV